MLSFINKKIKVAVHDGAFHPDDVFAVAILSIYLKKPLKIFRTRDEKIFTKMDYLLDVGTEYNPKENKFDHHQEHWHEKRENGIPYATSGLVWKEFGVKITGSKEVADKIEEKIIEPIDAEDSGVEIYKSVFEKVSPYSFFDYLFSFNPTWKEETDPMKVFLLAVSEAKKMLLREIKRAKDNCSAVDIVKSIYEKTEDKRIIILDNNYPWRKTLINYSEPLFVISPKSNKTWSIDTVVKPNEKFLRRLYFPLSWAGKRDADLEKVTGVSGAVFCHNDRFVAVAKTKEGAIELAKLALDNQ
jgi:uncharacterized UPF0160 family protein